MSGEQGRRTVRVLQVQPDLGEDLDREAFAEAERLLTAPVLTIPPGSWEPGECPGSRGRPFGYLVVGGVLVRELALAGRVSATLNGPGDIVGVDDLSGSSLPVRSRYLVTSPTDVAVLDDHFLAGARRYPRIVGRLVDATTNQIARAATHQAVSQLPRVQDRLLGLFWHLADRWGHVRPDGIVIDVPLTHEALGRLTGARRPTVSLGLQQLAEAGQLSRGDDGLWVLEPTSIHVLAGDEADLDRLEVLVDADAGPTAASAPARPVDEEPQALLAGIEDPRSAMHGAPPSRLRDRRGAGAVDPPSSQ